MGEVNITYGKELRAHWKELLGASMGVSTGITLNFFSLSIFGPALIKDLHWTKAQFALIGSLSLFSVFITPIVGTLVDRFGTRRAATAGFIGVPLGFVALSMMSGSIYQFLGINLAMNSIGLLTSGIVFCRALVERFDKARGISLALMMSAAPLSGAIVPYLITPIIAGHGWRYAYLCMALISAIGGMMAIALVGPTPKAVAEPDASVSAPGESTLSRLRTVARSPVFWLMLAGMFMVNMPRTFTISQLKLAVLDYGFADNIGTRVVSFYAIGTICGRCLSGLALDRVPTHLVAMVTMLIPAAGYMYFVFPVHDTAVLMAAVFAMGIAFGAEFDIGAFMISRNFPVTDFSKLYAALDVALGTGSALGALLMSLLLKDTGSYRGFMVVASFTTVMGAVLLALTGRYRKFE
jgi:MFS family permease